MASEASKIHHTLKHLIYVQNAQKGQFEVVSLVAVSINLNVQHVNGMTLRYGY